MRFTVNYRPGTLADTPGQKPSKSVNYHVLLRNTLIELIGYFLMQERITHK